MRIDRLFGQGLPTISFEFFPPRNEQGFAQLYSAVGELYSLKPSYVSITYGAGGSTRPKTIELVQRIQDELKIRSMAHLTCVGHTTAELAAVLDQLWNGGVENVLALRGDPQTGQAHFAATPGGMSHADELVALARARHDFCIGVAGYPEGHPECLNRIRDLEHLQRKIDLGANFIVTQLFFDNADFYRFRDCVRGRGINVPLIAGLMPVQSVNQIKRFISMCGAKIPHPLLLRLEAVEANADLVHQVGFEHSMAQCRDLLAHGVEGIHFYTLNRSRSTAQICRELNAEHAA